VTQAYLRLGRPDEGAITVAEQIVNQAEEIRAGLIVVGSRGLGGIRRALMGSVSDSVVRHAHCPVLVVRRGETT
jgi:nucleotide-binding universal stress UspA family protein